MLNNDRCIVGPINRLQWRALKFCAFLIIFSVLAEQSAADQAEILADDNRPKVLIILQPIQTELLGPDPFSFDWNLIPIFGGVLDGAITYSRSKEDVGGIVRDWQEMSGTFNFHDAVLSGIASLDKNANWQIAEITEYKWSGPTERMAHRQIRTEGYDYVFFANFIYFITPGLDQVRTWFSLRAYSRERTKRIFERNYEYLSQSRGDLFRPFLAGEKDAMTEAIENQYKLKVEQFPNNRKAYRKDRRDALNALENREVILPIMAINEGWPGDSFPTGLQLATDNILAMMQEDLLDISDDQAEGLEYVTFNGFDLKGNPKVFEGHMVGKQGLNTMYRDTKGNMYSVP